MDEVCIPVTLQKYWSGINTFTAQSIVKVSGFELFMFLVHQTIVFWLKARQPF